MPEYPSHSINYSAKRGKLQNLTFRAMGYINDCPEDKSVIKEWQENAHQWMLSNNLDINRCYIQYKYVQYIFILHMYFWISK